MKNIIEHLLIIGIGIFSLCLTGCNAAIKLVESNPAIVEVKKQSVLNDILNSKIIRVGTTGDFVPFSYQKNNSAAYEGIDIALAKDLANSLNVELQLVKTSWKTLITDLQANKFDIAMSGITITLARQQEAFFSIPLLSSGKAAITRDENATKYRTIADINKPGVKVIVNPGGTNQIFAKTNFPNATIILNEENLSIFKKIVDGTADVMVTDAIETLVQQQIHPELEAVNPNAPFNFFEMGYLLPIDYTFKAYIDQWLNLRLKDSTYQKIFDKELFKIKEEAEKN